MAGDTDAVLAVNPASGLLDLQIDSDGDIQSNDFFDTAILYSIFGERRADPSEVVAPELRRGWIGSEGKDYENGSKVWLYEQERITRSVLNSIEDEASKSLRWLSDDGYAVSIEGVDAYVEGSSVMLKITVRRSQSRVERRYYKLWDNTGTRRNAY